MSVGAAVVADDLMFIPILVPHGSRIDEVTMRYYSNGAMSTDAELDVIRVDSAASTSADVGVIDRLMSGGVPPPPVAMDPGAGQADYTYTCDQNQTVDLETYAYYITVQPGVDAAAIRTQRILHTIVKFSWVDIFPE